MDLAQAHVAALDVLSAGQRGATALNLGTGRGTSVLELVEAFGRASGRDIPYRLVERRDGDVAELWADPTFANQRLGWKAQHDLQRMCEDVWRWQSNNPDGFV
jgi:UDP-glucose 4-epimerase